MAHVSLINDMNTRLAPQQFPPTSSIAPTKHKAAMKRRAISTEMEKSVIKAKKIGAKAKALAKGLKNTARPLNSWIAYRSYYYKMFENSQQQDISTILRNLWQEDPFKAKWTILAKAFTVIRDEKGKKDASLDQFLAISGPFVEIVPPADYLNVMGYQLTIINSQATLCQRPHHHHTAFNHSLLTTTRSVDDLVDNCSRLGYFTENLNDTGPLSSQGAMIMATVTKSFDTHGTTGHRESSRVKEVDQAVIYGSQYEAVEGRVGNSIKDASAPSQSTNEHTAPDVQPLFHPIEDVAPANDSVFGAGAPRTIANSESFESGNPTTTGLDNAFPNLTMDMIKESFGEYPYNQAFNPCANDSYVFDPFNGYGFDAIDMDDLNAFNMNDWVQEEPVVDENVLPDRMFTGAPFI